MVDTTRRAILGVMASMPALAVSCAPQPASAAAGDFTRSLAAYRDALAAEDRHWQTIYEPAQKAFDAACEAVPHQSFPYGHMNLNMGCTLSTASIDDIRGARRRIKTRGNGPIHPINAPLAKADDLVVAAYEARQAEHERIAQAIGFNKVEEEGDRLSLVTYQLGWAAIECPVACAGELAAKMAFISELERWDCDTTIAALTADARRLAREA
jgi:hypothetical protein